MILSPAGYNNVASVDTGNRIITISVAPDGTTTSTQIVTAINNATGNPFTAAALDTAKDGTDDMIETFTMFWKADDSALSLVAIFQDEVYSLTQVRDSTLPETQQTVMPFGRATVLLSARKR